MKNNRVAFLSVFIIFFWITPVNADSPVWKIAKGDRALFIGGTVHLLTPSDYPLPDAFEQAYNASSIIVFETDFQKMQTPEFQKAMLREVALPEGVTLKDTIDREIYADFLDYLAQRSIPKDNIIKFKAGMVSITLTMIELQRLGLTGTGVDQFFSLRALNDRKATGQLETVEEQIAFIARMGAGRESELIAYTLKQMADIPVLIGTLKTAWRNGDHETMADVGLASMRKQFSGIYDDLILNRNKAWVPKIEAMLETPEVEFVLFGALHLVGDDGVLALLASRGYTIENF